MNKIVKYLTARLTEKSTWIGLIAAGAAATGLQLDPSQAQALALLGVAIAGAVAVFLPTKK